MMTEPKYDEKYCHLVVEAGKEGASETEMACMIGVLRSTLKTWSAVHNEFYFAFELAKQHAQVWFEKQAKEGMWSGKAFNAVAWNKQAAAQFDDYKPKQIGTKENPFVMKRDLSELSDAELTILAGIAGKV